MSQSSVVGQATHAVTHFGDWTSGNPNPLQVLTGFGLPEDIIHGQYEQMTQPPGSPTAPGAPPTLANSTMTALQTQLQNEISMRSASTLLTGASGTGGKPGFTTQVNTAGTTLLG